MLFSFATKTLLSNKIPPIAAINRLAMPLFVLGFFLSNAYATPGNIKAKKENTAYNQFDSMPVPQPKYIPPQAAKEPAAIPQNTPVPMPAPAQGDPQIPGTAKIGLADAQKLAQNLADKFSQIRAMMGNFIQFDPRGGMSTGSFYLERPGKILFDYKDTPLRVICDGKTIAINNSRLGSWNLYALDKSPLNLLLADKINIANGRLLEFTQEPNAVILVLGDATGHAKIRMIFDPKTYDLKQWTMTENGQDTTIQITNIKTGVEFAHNMFNINYYRYSKRRTK